MARKLALLGATGSIGRQTLEVLRLHRDRFDVRALTAHTRVADLADLIDEFQPHLAIVDTEEQAGIIRARCPGVEVLTGPQGLAAASAAAAGGIVVNALVGAAGILPTMAALAAGADVALANKETLVAAGDVVMSQARTRGVRVIPVDSEHSAIHQCLRGYAPSEVRRLILTASGGPFRGLSREMLENVGIADALAHPTWRMGAKITVDCATLMNKGFEVLEAHHLFQMPLSSIDVLVHPQSIVHSLVEFRDGAMLAQLGAPDMRVPIQYALFADEERPAADFRKLDLAGAGALTFEAVDLDAFPALRLAYDCGMVGGTVPAVLNAANEVADLAFLSGELEFVGIFDTVRAVIDRHEPVAHPEIGDVLEADAWARRLTRRMIEERGRMDC